MEGDCEKCIEAGMDDYISKPINFDTMFKMIETNTKESGLVTDYNNIVCNNIDYFVKTTGLKKDDAKEILEEYIKYLPNLLEDISNAIDNNDFDKLAGVTHELKGSSGTLRIMSIHELAIKLEAAALKQETDECARLFDKIKDLLH